MLLDARYHRHMPDTTREEEQADPDETSAPRPGGRELSRWAAPAALVIAVIAVCLAVWALVSASGKAPAAAEQPGDPKARVCAAYETVSRAVALQTHAGLGPDPVAMKAVAGNARLALIGGGQYLLNRLDSETPRELADAVRSFAISLQEIGVNQLAEVSNEDPVQAGRMSEVESVRKQIADLCK
jgi:hypothetical protein